MHHKFYGLGNLLSRCENAADACLFDVGQVLKFVFIFGSISFLLVDTVKAPREK